MSQKRCTVTIDADQKKVLGQVFSGDRVAGQQVWYLGRMLEHNPDEAHRMVRNKYATWAGAYGVAEADIEFVDGPLPPETEDEDED